MTVFSRISTNMMYGQSMKRLSTLQAQLDKTQRHISANTRILTPADDPVAAARALDLKQGKSMNTQFASNRGNAEDALKLQESTLNSFTGSIQDIQRLLVQAGDGAYDEEQIRVIADEITSLRDQMVGYANTRDAYGNYIFSGYQAGIQPFDMAVTGEVTYKGDDGQLMIQVDAARYLPVTDSGKSIFMGIKGMTASTVTPNRHDLVIDVDIKDETKLNDYSYEVRFAGDSPAASYTLWRKQGDGGWEQIDEDGVTPPAKPEGAAAAGTYPYTSDDKSRMEVEVDGVRFSISGEVSAGDTVKIDPGKPIRKDVFAYINEAIDLLNNADFNKDGGSTNLALGLEALIGNFDAALDQVVTARGSAGTRLKELDALEMSGSDKDLQYTESISDLEDLDYYEAISNLYMQQLTLQAAQRTFMITNGMSLFNMMS
ncbi:MAG: flagellar hook-associated protein FlgL [Alistipes senegalensis]|nr:flagellar hook-associated protein FlgL [Oxalobacter formigenes]MCM1281966.1 flagellar hook-associated protein FlgL [Alistipes senegalensis]